MMVIVLLMKMLILWWESDPVFVRYRQCQHLLSHYSLNTTKQHLFTDMQKVRKIALAHLGRV